MTNARTRMAAIAFAAGVALLSVVGRSEEPKPGPAAAGQSSDVADAKPAPVNPYNGMQEREEKFEFAQKPAVKKDGDKWVITFGSKANCDATVSIVDKDGKVIRHLASGVLGKNAPHPLQQNSLAQKLEWDGLDDQGKPAPSGCKVKVGLGLKAEFERSILWDPYTHASFEHSMGFQMSGEEKKTASGKVLVAKGQDGTIYVIGCINPGALGCAYDKDGKYLRTFFPPSAADVGKVMIPQGYTFATTIWGDKTLVGDKYGPFTGASKDTRGRPVVEQLADAIAALKSQPGAGEVTVAPLPPLSASAVPRTRDKNPHSVAEAFLGASCRMAADRWREEVYFGFTHMMFRVSGKTGELDKTWFPNGEMAAQECAIGPDGLLYLRVRPYGQWIVRLDHDGKPVDFAGDAVLLPQANVWPDDKNVYGALAGMKSGWGCPAGLSRAGPVKALYTGGTGHSNVHERGMYVSPRGNILAGIMFQGAGELSAYAIAHGVPKEHKGNQQSFVGVWDKDGKLQTLNALGDTGNGHGVFMDRDNNIYTVIPALGGKPGLGGNRGKGDKPDGIADVDVGPWGGTGALVKFRWSGKFPAASLDPQTGKFDGVLWKYADVPSQQPSGCTCFNVRCDMDYWARSWIPANHLYSVMVVDSNGNRVVRIGRYGNVDDADQKCGKIHFAWMRALCVSDTALYVADTANRRILKAALSYAAEETVLAP